MHLEWVMGQCQVVLLVRPCMQYMLQLHASGEWGMGLGHQEYVMGQRQVGCLHAADVAASCK